jgi:chromosome partition protein MukB
MPPANTIHAIVGSDAGRVKEAIAHHEEAKNALVTLDDEIASSAARYEGAAARLKAARTMEGRTEARRQDLERAHALYKRRTELETERESVRVRFTSATSVEERFLAKREVSRKEREQSRDAYERAARGLADRKAGLDELHRRAHAYRSAHALLEVVRKALNEPAFDASGVELVLPNVVARLDELDTARARMDHALKSQSVHREERARALAALLVIAPYADPRRAHEQARSALARLNELEATSTRIDEMQREHEQALGMAARQMAIRARAEEAGIVHATELSVPMSLVVAQRLRDAEQAAREAEQEARDASARAVSMLAARESALAQIDELEQRTAEWDELAPLATRLRDTLSVPVASREDVEACRVILDEQRTEVRLRLLQTAERMGHLVRERARFETAFGAVHPDLIRLRDELEAEFLIARFEEVSELESAVIEARLGPLQQALVVEDPVAAAAQLLGKPREVDTVWLVGKGEPVAHSDKHLDPGVTDFVTVEAHGVRVTRAPSHPEIGGQARAERARELVGEMRRLEDEVVDLRRRLADLDALVRAGDRLSELLTVFVAGDPRVAIERARALVRETSLDAEAASERAAAAKATLVRGIAEIDAYRALLSEAFLLDPPDYEARANALAKSMQDAIGSRAELQRVDAARKELSELLDALRHAPVEEGHDPAVAQAAQDAEREQLFRAREALVALSHSRHALSFEDAARAFTDETATSPALEEQLAVARAASKRDEEALADIDAALEDAVRVRQQASGAADALTANIERLRGEITALTDVEPVSRVVDEAREVARVAEAERVVLERDERTLAMQITRLRERRAHTAGLVETSRRRVAELEQAAEPAAARVQEAARAEELSAIGALGRRVLETYAGRPSAALWAETRSRAEVLVDRLRTSRGGTECVASVEAVLETVGRDANPSAALERVLEGWQSVRDWVRRHLPISLSGVADPIDAVDRLRHELSTLEEHLRRQESDLRCVSEDVARGIDVQLRRAKGQVRRLNQNLDGVSFGSIKGIRVTMQRIDRMEQVLRALREGAAQELLFQPNLPIEEALTEIFRRFSGGGAAARGGSARLLDYREYVELAVEIQRRSEGDWERASATRLSTGEAIGVGAALMMVILTEWERDADLLRPKRTSGSLRFLFLDEANRLSQDNLGVLFDLCRTLDLQLLIAAPEVARAEGNTTYRLVRRVLEGGREEVLVSGRRTTLPSAVEGEAAPPEEPVVECDT